MGSQPYTAIMIVPRLFIALLACTCDASAFVAHTFRASNHAVEVLGMTPNQKEPNPIVLSCSVAVATMMLAVTLSTSAQAATPVDSPPIAASPTPVLISRIEVQPLGGFGGLGIGPFGAAPFGGFGFGFTVKNEPPPPTKDQVMEQSKQELAAVKRYESRLEEQIKTLEKERATTNIQARAEK